MEQLEFKIKQTLWITSIVLGLNACGDGGSSDSNSTKSNPRPTQGPIIHNGTMYGTVVSPITGHVWLDRNLGAERVCIASDDEQCYGDYYQWGRGFDGHQDRYSATTQIKEKTLENTSHMFIEEDNNHYQDWFYAESVGLDHFEETLIKRAAFWSKSDGSSICPVGFKVPTSHELALENDAINKPKEGYEYDTPHVVRAFRSFLKLPSSGFRRADTTYVDNSGTKLPVIFLGTTEYNWRAPVTLDSSRINVVTYTIIKRDISISSTYFEHGLPIRCIQCTSCAKE